MTPRTKGLLPLALAAAFLVASTSTLAAKDIHTQSRFPVSLSVTNTCNGELVDFTGELHVNAHSRLNKDGSTTSFVEINWADAHGVGETTGAAYVFGSNSQSITIFPPGSTGFYSYSQRQTEKLVSAGAGENMRFTFLLAYTLDANGFTVTLNDFEVRCTGQ